jgi:YD repeat-containing protein
VSTYTYRPMVGMSTETDPNGKTQYYLYDGFNRLKAVKDKDGNVVGKNKYQLAD